jgi:hypothetical protein
MARLRNIWLGRFMLLACSPFSRAAGSRSAKASIHTDRGL